MNSLKLHMYGTPWTNKLKDKKEMRKIILLDSTGMTEKDSHKHQYKHKGDKHNLSSPGSTCSLARICADDLSNFEIDVLQLDIINPDSSENPKIIEANPDNPPTSSKKNEKMLQVTTMSSVDVGRLPDVVLVHIFSYLGVRDRCQMACVCKQWQSAVKNPCLWRIVQESPSDSHNLMRFLRCYIGKSVIFFRPCSMSTAGLQFIKQNCTNIQALWLVDIQLAGLDLTNMPSTLKSLALVPHPETCGINGEWWKLITTRKFPNLDFLYLARTEHPDAVLQQVSELTTLTGFRLEECENMVSEATFMAMTKKLTDLEFLSLSGCNGVKVEYLEHIGRNLKKLHHLRLNRFWSLNPEEDLSAITSLPKLKKLHIQNGVDMDNVQVQEFSDSVVSTIQMFSRLESLVLSNFDAFYEAVLIYTTAKGLKSIHKNMEVFLEKESNSYRVRVVQKCTERQENAPV